MKRDREKISAVERKIIDLEKELQFYKEENKKLADRQQKLGEVTNNYLMLHYLNKNIQNCRTSESLWQTYLHNISDKGFNYSNAAVFLPDDRGLFTIKYFLKNGKLNSRQSDFSETHDFIVPLTERRECWLSSDQKKAAIPMVNHFGVLKAVLVVEKEGGFSVEDLELLDVYVQQTVATIENIALNERLLHYQDLLGKRLDQFVFLHYVAKEINDGVDYYDVLKKYLQVLESPVGFNFKESRLYILEDSGVQRAFLDDGELFLETADVVEQLILDAVERKCGALSPDNAVLAMPLITDGKVSAVIEIVNGKEIDLEQMQILEIFALQTSSVLDNARLRMNLEYMSFHDALTGLYNRAFFEQHLRKLKQQKKKKNVSVGIMMCDINELKYVNDTRGHYAGDALIVAAANTIKSAIGNGAVAARIGGDEFVVLVSPCTEADLAAIYQRIQTKMAHYNDVDSPPALGMAIGWAFSEANPDLDDLFRCADRKMYAEKKKSRYKQS